MDWNHQNSNKFSEINNVFLVIFLHGILMLTLHYSQLT